MPKGIRGRTNPRSSTGRLDVFTRVITDMGGHFDEVRDGYQGELFLEVVPMSFTIKVRTGITLNQLRLMTGVARLSDDELLDLSKRDPIIYPGDSSEPGDRAVVSDGLFLSVDLSGKSFVGYRAKKSTRAPRPEPQQCVRGRRLLGAGRAVEREADPRRRRVLPPRLARARSDPARLRRRDGRLRPDERRAPDPLRGLLRPRVRRRHRTARPERRPCSRSGRTTSRSRSSTASGCASSPSSGWPHDRMSCTARRSARAINARSSRWDANSVRNGWAFPGRDRVAR